MTRIGAALRCFFVLLLVASCGSVATAQVTYTYTGHPFNSVAYWPYSITSMGTHVTATVTLPIALPDNATTCIASTPSPSCSNAVINLNGFSWEISDGVNSIFNTYPKGSTGGTLNSLTFTTDANGNIINWQMDASGGTYAFEGGAGNQTVQISTTNEAAPGIGNNSDVSSIAYYLDSISADPGSWASSGQATAAVVGGAGSGSIAAGGVATIYGNFAGFSTTSGLATALAGVEVKFPGLTAPLTYVSPTQVTFQVPWEFQQGTSAQQTPLSLTLNGNSVANVLLSPLPQAAPGIFEMNPQHQAAALDPSGQLIGPSNPAAPGSPISIYCTGLGPVTVPQTDGAPAPLNQLVWTTTLPVVMIGGAPAQVLFSGLVPGSAGLYQINVVVPDVPAGAESLTVTMLNVVSNTTTLQVD